MQMLSCSFCLVGAVVHDYELLPALDQLVSFGTPTTAITTKGPLPQAGNNNKDADVTLLTRRVKITGMPAFVKQVGSMCGV